MKTMEINEFQSHFLEILSHVEKAQEVVVLTIRGKPLAQISPCRDLDKNPKPGRLADSLVFEKEIVSPLDEEAWGSCK